MTEQIVALCKQLGAGDDRDALLRPLAQGAYEQLSAGLRPGVTPEDCGEIFPLACAMTVMGALQELTGEDRITAFTAGEVTIRTEGPGQNVRMARRLLSPWMEDEGFCVRGVEG